LFSLTPNLLLSHLGKRGSLYTTEACTETYQIRNPFLGAYIDTFKRKAVIWQARNEYWRQNPELSAAQS
jgi:hypothetical protein